MSKPVRAGYEVGNHWVTCDRCGVEFRHDQVAKEWNGLVVCLKKCWEPRNTQDFVRAVTDDQNVSGLIRPDPADVFIDTCTNGPTAIVGMAIVGCAVIGVDTPPTLAVPQGTNNNAD